MEKYYTIFDIISGLRLEYLKTKEELESLKKYIEILCKNIDIEFFVNAGGYDYPNILYRLYRTGLTSVERRSDGKYGRFIPHAAPEKVEKVGSIYFVPEKRVFVKDDEEFSSGIDKILNSDFTKSIYFEKNFGDFRLRIDSCWISFGNSDVDFICHACKDDYSIVSSQFDLLSYEIPQSELSDYHVEKIEKNKSLKKMK